MPRDRRRLVIDLEVASAVRSRVGPTGWLILEAVAAEAPVGESVVEMAASSRSLAEHVGTSKDSVARALRVLIDAGLVERADHRDELSGRFTSTSYVVDLTAAGIGFVDVSSHAVAAPHGKAPRPVAANTLDDQLSLLP